jgi:hypothetical protein
MTLKWIRYSIRLFRSWRYEGIGGVELGVVADFLVSIFLQLTLAPVLENAYIAFMNPSCR